MKYELEPNNRNCPDEVLLNDLRAVARHLGKSSLTRKEYSQIGRFSGGTVEQRFGSWNRALAQSGLTVQRRVDIPRQELVADLQCVANLLGSQAVTQAQYDLHGMFSHDTLTEEFGSWAKALAVAQLQPITGWKPKTTEEDLLRNMAAVWESIGRQPRQRDFRPPMSRFTADPYVRHYGSWRKALEAFVSTANSDEIPSAMTETANQGIATSSQSGYKHRTPRNPSWRLRFLAMRRDNFRCCICGKTQSDGNPLELDHIKPWDDGGETVMENLQTLCQQCNGGKSNLSMQDS